MSPDTPTATQIKYAVLASGYGATKSLEISAAMTAETVRAKIP